MPEVLWLFAVQGTLGAFDTLYYHEYRAKLPAGGAQTRAELRLHAVRDFIYAVLFVSLPWFSWGGLWALLLVALLLTEIVLTLSDFVVEDRVRKPLGGVFPGERVMHAVMGILYGAMLANLLPVVWGWFHRPTALLLDPPDAPTPLRLALCAMGLGVFLSGVRDLYATTNLPYRGFPWA